MLNLEDIFHLVLKCDEFNLLIDLEVIILHADQNTISVTISKGSDELILVFKVFLNPDELRFQKLDENQFLRNEFDKIHKPSLKNFFESLVSSQNQDKKSELLSVDNIEFSKLAVASLLNFDVNKEQLGDNKPTYVITQIDPEQLIKKKKS